MNFSRMAETKILRSKLSESQVEVQPASELDFEVSEAKGTVVKKIGRGQKENLLDTGRNQIQQLLSVHEENRNRPKTVGKIRSQQIKTIDFASTIEPKKRVPVTRLKLENLNNSNINTMPSSARFKSRNNLEQQNSGGMLATTRVIDNQVVENDYVASNLELGTICQVSTIDFKPLKQGPTTARSIISSRAGASFFEENRNSEDRGISYRNKLLQNLKAKVRTGLTAHTNHQNQVNEGIKLWLAKSGDGDQAGTEAGLIDQETSKLLSQLDFANISIQKQLSSLCKTQLSEECHVFVKGEQTVKIKALPGVRHYLKIFCKMMNNPLTLIFTYQKEVRNDMTVFLSTKNKFPDADNCDRRQKRPNKIVYRVTNFDVGGGGNAYKTTDDQLLFNFEYVYLCLYSEYGINLSLETLFGDIVPPEE